MCVCVCVCVCVGVGVFVCDHVSERLKRLPKMSFITYGKCNSSQRVDMSVGRSVGWMVCLSYFLQRREVTPPCSNFPVNPLCCSLVWSVGLSCSYRSTLVLTNHSSFQEVNIYIHSLDIHSDFQTPFVSNWSMIEIHWFLDVEWSISKADLFPHSITDSFNHVLTH